MFYYRYRPYNEVTVKELLYNEMYFSSPEECNDPFDSKTFYEFGADKEMWSKVIKLSVERAALGIITEELVNLMAEHLCRKSPMTFDEALKANLFEDLQVHSSIQEFLSSYGILIQNLLSVYRPATRYFVSFSEINSEPLMWSHYADKHKGFCLVFRAIHGALYQSPHQKKHQIVRATNNGIAPSMSYGIPESFQFTKINYESEVEPLNAFQHLPAAITGEMDIERVNKIRQDQECHYTQKSKSWEYEAEYRLMLRPPLPWLFGEHFDYSKQERLFHYQPSQLVGIIYGARMEATEKNRLKELLNERRDWRVYPDEEGTKEFSFIEYNAVLSHKQREVIIKPTGLLSYKTIPTTDPDFDRLYQELLDGWGWERHKNGSKKMKVE